MISKFIMPLSVILIRSSLRTNLSGQSAQDTLLRRKRRKRCTLIFVGSLWN
ncbi:UNVERIFIED_CONTAM: hypothetical protein GTU68_049753 [Idotea baltica]|nr:hypothetical protein [Idotea baltica]